MLSSMFIPFSLPILLRIPQSDLSRHHVILICVRVCVYVHISLFISTYMFVYDHMYVQKGSRGGSIRPSLLLGHRYSS